MRISPYAQLYVVGGMCTILCNKLPRSPLRADRGTGRRLPRWAGKIAVEAVGPF